MNRCTIILATQRSGSTFVERCLSGTGLAGNFSEHFIKLLDQYRDKDAGPHKAPSKFLDHIQSCRDASGNYGMTFMADYFPEVSASFFGEKYQNSAEWKHEVSLRFLGHLENYFDRVDCILLTRNVVRQAVSDMFAVGTGVYHYVDGQTLYGHEQGKTATQEDVLSTFDVASALKRSKKRMVENQFLKSVLSQRGSMFIEINYEEATRNPSALNDVLFELDFKEARSKEIVPKTKKVLSDDVAQRAGALIADYLEIENWTWESLEKFCAGIRYDYWLLDTISSELEERSSESEERSRMLQHVYRYPWKHMRSFIRRR